MKAFRFRAQAALDLRHREDDAARRACAEAEAWLLDARARLAQTRASLAGAQAAHGMQCGPEAAHHEREWYRFWIAGLRQAVGRAGDDVARFSTELDRRRAARQVTRQRVDALERFRDKARQAWEAAVQAEEQRLMDAAGTARFVAQRRAPTFGSSATGDRT
ncbi:MAG: flagellar FliJ family protein [Vicinamibacterales bacterium]